MSTYTRRHGGHTATIHAPAAGSPLDVAAVRADLANPVLGLDVETRAIVEGGPGHFGPDAGVRLVQLATPATAWVFDVADDAQRALVAELLTDPARRFVSHTSYDVLAVWSAFGIGLGQRAVDTHLLSKLVEPDERAGHGLKEVTGRYLDDGLKVAEGELRVRAVLRAPKGQRAGDAAMRWAWNHLPADDEAYCVYAGMDAIYVRRLLPVLLQLCAPFSHLVTVEQWLAAQAVGITIRGLALDEEYVRSLFTQVEAENAAAGEAIRGALGFPATSPRFAEWLDGHGIDGPRTDTGRLSVTAGNLAALVTAQEAGTVQVAPQVAAMITARQRVSATSNVMTNLRGFLAHADAAGRVHPAVNTLRARTGRMSVTGPALQTLKKADKRLRRSFRADPGHTLVSCDFKAVEVRVAAALSRDRALRQVIESGLDIHDATAALMFGEGFTDQQRTLSKRATFGCVPLDTEILTRRGWLRHDEVLVGDETPGFDPVSRSLRWTPVTAVARYSDAPLVHLANRHSGWSATVTPNHRWVAEKRRDGGRRGRYYELQITQTDQLTREHRLVLGAVEEGTQGLPITADEAAIIGWLHTDGRVAWKPLTGRTAQAGGRRRGVRASIFQAKPAGVAVIDALLANVAHRRYRRKPHKGTLPAFGWDLHPAYVRGLWDRAGLHEGTLAAFVLRLSQTQRAAFLHACWQAEGHTTGSGTQVITQNEGDTLDAIALAAYLEGRYVRTHLSDTRGRRPNYKLILSQPRVTMQRVQSTDAGRGDVWCVSTRLGTWTMRQGGRVMLTGNTIYGGGVRALAAQTGVPEHVAADVIDRWRETYPQVIAYGKRISYDPIVVTGSGRRIPADPARSYANSNYSIQSTARDLLVAAVYELVVTHGLDPAALWLFVHDEVILHVPSADAEDVQRLVERAMTSMYRGVPIEADAEILGTHWGHLDDPADAAGVAA